MWGYNTYEEPTYPYQEYACPVYQYGSTHRGAGAYTYGIPQGQQMSFDDRRSERLYYQPTSQYYGYPAQTSTQMYRQYGNRLIPVKTVHWAEPVSNVCYTNSTDLRDSYYNNSPVDDAYYYDSAGIPYSVDDAYYYDSAPISQNRNVYVTRDNYQNAYVLQRSPMPHSSSRYGYAEAQRYYDPYYGKVNPTNQHVRANVIYQPTQRAAPNQPTGQWYYPSSYTSHQAHNPSRYHRNEQEVEKGQILSSSSSSACSNISEEYYNPNYANDKARRRRKRAARR